MMMMMITVINNNKNKNNAKNVRQEMHSPLEHEQDKLHS